MTPATARPRRNPFAVAALTVACAGLPFTVLPPAFVVTIPLGVAGVVTGLAGRRAARRRDGRGRDMSTAAVAVSAFVIALGVLGALLVWNADRIPPDPSTAGTRGASVT